MGIFINPYTKGDDVPDLRLPGQVHPAAPCTGTNRLGSPILVRPRPLRDSVHSALGSSPEDSCTDNKTVARWSFRLSWYAHRSGTGRTPAPRRDTWIGILDSRRWPIPRSAALTRIPIRDTDTSGPGCHPRVVYMLEELAGRTSRIPPNGRSN
jgi:hypothetical protein